MSMLWSCSEYRFAENCDGLLDIASAIIHQQSNLACLTTGSSLIDHALACICIAAVQLLNGTHT
jgi:hypothetical protein